MKKKILALLASAIMILSLCSCGAENDYNEVHEYNKQSAEMLATDMIVPLLASFADDETIDELSKYTYDEVAYIIKNYYELEVEGYPFVSAISNFKDGLDIIGDIESIDDCTSVIDKDQIIVEVSVTGTKQNATAQVIVSNDMFLVLESAALNPEASFGDKMAKAGLNTLIGMGTVFVVLVLIIGVISLFVFIPKAQKKMDEIKKRKEEKKNASVSAIDNAVNQIEQNESIDETDDLELVAVISAAIAAYEGNASASGYVVRSIKKISSRRV